VTPNVLLIETPHLDLPTFLSLCEQVLGYSPARAADKSNLQGFAHLLACLATFRDKDATPSVKGAKDVYNLLHFGFIIASDDYDMAPILEVLGGMPFALTETKLRGVQAAFITGTLPQWRQAVLRGCRQDQTETIRVCFDKVYLQFQQAGLADAFGKLTKKTLATGTFYLEDMR
jgi:hypothetical protein